ncbi:hypothetical protein ACHQM5_023395 [Ranunculus cassubicifolius]
MHNCRHEQSPLCDLIKNSLQPFTIMNLSPLTKQTEINLLLLLSKATFLNSESQFVRHATRNILVGISSYLAKFGTQWDGYLHVLFACLEVATTNILSPTTDESPISGTTVSDSDLSRLIIHVKEKMLSSNWYTVAGLLGSLRIIAKNLKQCPGDEHKEYFMNSLDHFLKYIPWELLSGIHVAEDSEPQISSSKNLSRKFDSPVSNFLFLGSLLQLLCSLVHESSFNNEHPVLGKIAGLVPELVRWCLHKNGDDTRTTCYPYLNHKMLMLMTRLSLRVHQESCNIVLWLQLLHKHYQDLLHRPISQSPAIVNVCLEGSPFLTCISDGQKVDSHLQRQAIFLFLKCSISLIRLDDEADTKQLCTTSDSCTLPPAQESCSRDTGLLEMSAWLNKHVPLDVIVSYELYLDKCSRFALSFLRLYRDEDDFLFEVLLLLFDLPLHDPQVKYKNKNKTKDLKEFRGDILFHLSNIFNPVHIFHLFLAELHYDHSVLLDYLIAKNAGIQCLQYLLRCLRAVSNSWNLFLEFPVCENEVWSVCKKRKFSDSGSGSDGEVDLTSATGNVTNCNLTNMLTDARKRCFQNAKECLLSLKNSIESLHQKDLFPYNPTALLRSFTRFGKLCIQQESVHLKETGK